ncbi:MAG TPA: hypothetical protein DEF85_06920 [Clostridiaceae bacterium]|jgi:cell fate (sporulation/competence/biofilm development) regulator YlbF (YheA/YmcA/DUF963 family)|nr:hypothetical protein [Clostridiaceae bacterium]HBG38170.1 hypothetical protein [Clostridiaceae bacterium]HBN29537.1 hypothetical protein [Clostridiaceae bacterium]HBX48605.1 hypothetical protein [Clostridiaceae bacterium]HCL51261.1 hypothetical protein [Clostridiaceae bacterium]
MNNIYDKANELASALKESPEIINYKKQLEKINANPSNKKMVDDLRKQQLEIYSMQVQGIEPPQEKIEKLQSLWSVINLNPDVREYMEAEMKFSTLWKDLMKILSDAIGVDLSLDDEDNK